MCEEERIETAEDKMNLALLLLVDWKRFLLFCRQRTKCDGCPYFKDRVCSVASTEVILFKVADVAEEYLAEKNIEAGGKKE